MGRSKRGDRVEAALRRADANFESWLRRGAGVIRQRVDGLRGGLKALSRGLERVEQDPKPATKTRRERPAATRRAAARPRKTKKAA